MIGNGYQFVYFRPHNDKTNLSLAIIVYQIFSPYFSPQDNIKHIYHINCTNTFCVNNLRRLIFLYYICDKETKNKYYGDSFYLR